MPSTHDLVTCTVCGMSCSVLCYSEHSRDFVCHTKDCPLHRPRTYEYYRGKIYMENDPILQDFSRQPRSEKTYYSSHSSSSPRKASYASEDDEDYTGSGRYAGRSHRRDSDHDKRHHSYPEPTPGGGGGTYHTSRPRSTYEYEQYPAPPPRAPTPPSHRSSGRPSAHREYDVYDPPSPKPTRRSSRYEDERGAPPPPRRHSTREARYDDGYPSSSSSSSRHGSYYGRTAEYGRESEWLRREIGRARARHGWPEGLDSARWVCLTEVREVSPGRERVVEHLPPAPYVMVCVEDPDGKVVEKGPGFREFYRAG